MQNVLPQDKRTTDLELADKRNINALIKQARTVTAAAAILGISRQALTTIIKSGTCAPSTLETFREYFGGKVGAQ